MPASPANVRGFAPIATPRRVISARPRVVIAAFALSPEPERVDRAGDDRDDVLQRPGELDAKEVAVAVEAQGRAREALDDGLADRIAGRGDDRGRRQPAGDLRREVRPRQGGHPALGRRRRLDDDLAHPAAASRARCPSRPRR